MSVWLSCTQGLALILTPQMPMEKFMFYLVLLERLRSSVCSPPALSVPRHSLVLRQALRTQPRCCRHPTSPLRALLLPENGLFKKIIIKKMKHAIIIIRAAACSPRTDTQHMARGCLPLNNSGSSSPLRFSAPSLGSHNSPPPSPCLLPGSWAGIPNILWAQLCPSRQLPPALLIARGAAGWFVFSSCFLGPFPVLSRQGGKRQAGRAGRAPLPSLCGCEDALRTHVLQVRPLTREKNLLVPAWKIPSRKEYSLRCKFTILCAENELIFPAQSTGNLFVGMNSNTSSSPGKLVPISRSREQHPRLAYPWDEWARN